VQLEAGRAHGIDKDTEFAVYPTHATSFDDPAARLAIAKVKTAGDVVSTAKLTVVFSQDVDAMQCWCPKASSACSAR